jgi:hypothetical protein
MNGNGVQMTMDVVWARYLMMNNKPLTMDDDQGITTFGPHVCKNNYVFFFIPHTNNLLFR